MKDFYSEDVVEKKHPSVQLLHIVILTYILLLGIRDFIAYHSFFQIQICNSCHMCISGTGLLNL